MWSNQSDVRPEGAAGAAHRFGWNYIKEGREKEWKRKEKRSGEEEQRGENVFSLQSERSHVSEASVTLHTVCVVFAFPGNWEGHAMIRMGDKSWIICPKVRNQERGQNSFHMLWGIRLRWATWLNRSCMLASAIYSSTKRQALGIPKTAILRMSMRVAPI